MQAAGHLHTSATEDLPDALSANRKTHAVQPMLRADRRDRYPRARRVAIPFGRFMFANGSRPS
jgi:hypothetical protein